MVQHQHRYNGGFPHSLLQFVIGSFVGLPCSAIRYSSMDLFTSWMVKLMNFVQETGNQYACGIVVRCGFHRMDDVSPTPPPEYDMLGHVL